MADVVTWSRYWTEAAEDALEAGEEPEVQEGIADLLLLVAGWDGPETLDLQALRYHAGDLSDRQLVRAWGVIRVMCGEEEGGELAVQEALESIRDTVMDEIAFRGLSWEALV
jgi:hypothetical protein